MLGSNLFTILFQATLETIYMVFASAFFALLIGLPLGITLFITGKKEIKPHVTMYNILDGIVNIGRSFPFAILIIAVIPLTRWIVGTSLGTTASIVPLSIAASPLIARIVENSFKEIDSGIIEASIVIGSSTWEMINKILLVEAFPNILSGMTLTIINLVGYSAMAGLVGGGGLGTVAIQYGYLRFDGWMMLWTVLLLILLVQIIQTLGNYFRNTFLHKRGMK